MTATLSLLEWHRAEDEQPTYSPDNRSDLLIYDVRLGTFDLSGDMSEWGLSFGEEIKQDPGTMWAWLDQEPSREARPIARYEKIVAKSLEALDYALEMDVQMWESCDGEGEPPYTLERQKAVHHAAAVLRHDADERKAKIAARAEQHDFSKDPAVVGPRFEHFAGQCDGGICDD